MDDSEAADPRKAANAAARSDVEKPSAAAVPTGSSPLASDVLAERYELLGLLGRGGMGSVYRARDRVLGEVVALKVVRRDLAGADEMLARFRREVKLARRVTHPNVARTFDIAEHQDQAFLTMEYVDGESLARLLARDGALPVERAVEVALALCDALAAAHAAGVVHRDLKPENVLVATDGRIVVTDFGIARALKDEGAGHTLPGLMGTPAYMAPEQVEGAHDVDHRADLYALGAVLYELLTGQCAWQGASPVMVAAARLSSPPPDARALRPSVPAALASVVKKLMARRREDRPTTAAAARAALVEATHTATGDAGAVSHTRPIAPVPADAAAKKPGEKALAVLPFRNGGPSEDDYVADGLTEDLIDTLSMNRSLRLRPRGTVMRFKGKDGDARAFGAELGVDVVVEGSVRRAGAGYRINVRLIGVADGFQLWATRLDRPMSDLLVVVDELARAVATAMTEQAEDRGRKAPSNPFAVEIYLRARAALRDSWHSAAGSARAADLCAQALALSPDDPVLLGGAAIARIRATHWGKCSAEEGAVTVATVRRDARRALELEPHAGEPWLALAMADLYEGRPHDAVHLLTLGIVAAPQYAPAHALLGRILREVGLLDDAFKSLNTALELDPTDLDPLWQLTFVAGARRDWRRVDELLARPVSGNSARVQRLNTNHRMRLWRRAAGLDVPPLNEERVQGDGLVQLHLETYDSLEATGTMSDDLRRRIEARLGQSAGTVRMQLISRPMITEYLLAAGDPDAAFRMLSPAVELGLAELSWFDHCPLLDPYRNEPRWLALRARIEAHAHVVVDAWRAASSSSASGMRAAVALPAQRIEVDAALREREVAQIADSEFFKQLQGRVQALRRRPVG